MKTYILSITIVVLSYFIFVYPLLVWLKSPIEFHMIFSFLWGYFMFDPIHKVLFGMSYRERLEKEEKDEDHPS